MRSTILEIGRAAIRAVEPGAAVRSVVRKTEDGFRVGDQHYRDRDFNEVLILGAGKASPKMAAELELMFGDRVRGGLVVTKDGYSTATRCVEIVQAGHPVPDDRGQKAARRLVEVAQGAGENDLLICVISGGGSALTPAPPSGISLSELQSLTDQLLRSGATIDQMNTVRKHLSVFHGGLLAKAAHPTRVVSLLVSDVVGNPVDVIASGPTVPDPTTFSDALAVLDELDLRSSAPTSICERLEAGVRGGVSETPMQDDPIFKLVSNLMIADNARAGQAAVEAAIAAGFDSQLITSRVQGEAREVANVIAGAAIDIARNNRPVKSPGCAVFGGETTVTVRGDGLGGRSQELALAAAKILAGESNVAVFSMATDGTDGPTDACGGLVDGATLTRAAANGGGDIVGALADNDAYTFLKSSGDLVKTGPTGTNVNDLYMAFGW